MPSSSPTPAEPIARYLSGRVAVYVGDITEHPVDAIVNAANSSLLGGGGVDGAIHRRGGTAITEACQSIRRTSHPQGLPTGEAVITTGGALPARFVIHTVGPIYRRHNGHESALLAACYRNSLALAHEWELRTIAFPAISTGVYGYPPQEAALVVSRTLVDSLAGTSLEETRLVFFQESQAQIFMSHCQF